MSFFDKLKSGLYKTRKGITNNIDKLLKSFGKIDDELFDEIEEILISADVGVNTTLNIMEKLKFKVKKEGLKEPEGIMNILKEELENILEEENNELNTDPAPSVIIVLGVNGVGKTTSIGKIANMLKRNGKKVIIAAADTFRAAAIEQLTIWADRAGADVIKHSEGADPGAVVYDAVQAAKARNADVLICDTAGRLHTKKNLVEELKKIHRIVEREFEGAIRENLLVLDATTGQNAISQAKAFSEQVSLSGIVLTKLDGTAKGGIILAIKTELNIPVKLIGIGEQMDDLQKFNPKEFIDALMTT